MKIFIASSTEGLPAAAAVQVNLEGLGSIAIWNQGLFEASSYPLDVIEREAADADYGIFVMTPDDMRRKGGNTVPVPRDNVVFEFGVFVGRLGRKRSFLVVPGRDAKIQMPSDLEGLTQVRYESAPADGNLIAALGPACTKIKNAIDRREAAARADGIETDNDVTRIAAEISDISEDDRMHGSFIHPSGRVQPSYTGAFLQGATSEICILGFSLRSFIGYFDSRPEAEITLPIVEALTSGARVVFLFLDPVSHAAKTFAKERNDKRILAEIRRSILRASELRNELADRAKGKRIELRTYSHTPFGHIKRVDGQTSNARLMFLPYLPGLRRPDTPYVEVRALSNPKLFAALSSATEHILQISSLI